MAWDAMKQAPQAYYNRFLRKKLYPTLNQAQKTLKFYFFVSDKMR